MEDVDNYIAVLPDEYRKIIEHIRSVVKAHVPEATESISYDMPTFKYKGRPLFYYAAFKHHMSVFPTPAPAEALSKELAGYKTSKGTIQFTPANVLKDELIVKLLDLRMADIS